MNNTRRREVKKIMEALFDLKIDLEAVLGDEQAAYDNLPESLQDTERGESMTEAIDAMDEAVRSIEEACDQLESFC